MDVDRDAPAYAEGGVEIDAPRERVWQVLSDIANWPSWSPGVTTAQLTGPVATGSSFKWKSGRNAIKSELLEVDAPSAISWSGRTTGIKAMHAWQLAERDGTTVVTTQESWHGLVVKVLRHSIQPTLQTAIDDALTALKAESERPT
jgi:uncharacterized protein YndB with AHSA1/START domain